MRIYDSVNILKNIGLFYGDENMDSLECEYGPHNLEIENLKHPADASRFLKKLKEIAKTSTDKNVVLKGRANAFFPNALLPIAGIIEYYKSIGFKFQNEIRCKYLGNTNFLNPLNLQVKEIREMANPYNTVFYFETDEQVNAITQKYVDVLSQNCLCEEGVLEGINWCIAEIMDNVLVHSGSSYGLVMAQIHSTTKHIAFCIYDSGVGIYRTISTPRHTPESEIEALSIAIQEGTSDGKGQGNGLYGLCQIVKNNNGRLSLTSGSSSLMMDSSGEFNHFSNIPYIDQAHCGTLVDFQLDFGKSIDLKEAFRTIGGFTGLDMRIDNMLREEDESIHYIVLENARGTATRQSGEYLRNDIMNTFNRTKRHMILDFEGIQNVSSSFIDEVIAKLVVEFGFVGFNQIFSIINMTQEIAFLCNRSLYMRIHEEWQTKNDSV